MRQMKDWSGRVGLACFVVGLGGPVLSEWLEGLISPPLENRLLQAAPILFVVGLVCGIVGWKTRAGKIGGVANGFMLAVVGFWIVWVTASGGIRWG